MAAPQRVAVVGGGITGLAAAHALLTNADDAAPAPQVIVFERDDRLGGKLQTSPFASSPGHHHQIGRASCRERV